jgi:hypothetical protein
LTWGVRKKKTKKKTKRKKKKTKTKKTKSEKETYRVEYVPGNKAIYKGYISSAVNI